jgi:DNA polymerase-3 subunit gamma/tau
MPPGICIVVFHMAYQVIARKYRPQQFDAVIGQDVIMTTLKNAIEQKRIGHAYLFSGVRGVGKTTSARILAKALNCVTGPTPTPCETCDSCNEIRNGNSVDVIEIDAASNRSIDDVRQLRENVKYRPSRDRYKIYIIDEAHQLTDDAWDALLKTLEEPPDHVVFIFATTERHKLKPTILSRCQNFSFRTLSYHEIYRSLEQICAQEKIQITPAALSMLSRSAEGSIRDAQSLLDQVISFCGESIDESKIRELLGFVSQEYLDRLSAALIARDTTAVLKLVDDLIRAGFDPRHFSREAIHHIRNLMILRVAGAQSELLELPADEIERLSKVASNFSEEDLVRFFHLLTRTENDLKWSTHPRLHLELGLVKLVQAARLMSIEEFLADLRSGKTDIHASLPAVGTSGTRPAGSNSSGSPAVKKNSNTGMNAVSAGNVPPIEPGLAFTAPPHIATEATQTPASEVSSPTESPQIASFRQAVFSKSKFLDSMLDHALSLSFEDPLVRVVFSETDRNIYSFVNTQEQIASLNQVCQNVFGKNSRVKLVLADTPGEPPAAPSTPQPVRPAPRATFAGSEEEVSRDPQVRSFLETFRAQITSVKKR